MKIIKTKHFPPGGYSTINLFGVLFTKLDNLPKYVINHEKIHTAQMKEFWYVGFYLWYGLEYLIVRLFHKKQAGAYHDVSFEEEAYANQYDLSYLQRRKKFAWWQYIRIRSYDKLPLD